MSQAAARAAGGSHVAKPTGRTFGGERSKKPAEKSMEPAPADFELLKAPRRVDEMRRRRRPGDRAAKRRQVIRAALVDAPTADRQDPRALVCASLAKRDFVKHGVRDHVRSVRANLALERCEADRGHREIAAFDSGEGLVGGRVEASPRELDLDMEAPVARFEADRPRNDPASVVAEADRAPEVGQVDFVDENAVAIGETGTCRWR